MDAVPTALVAGAMVVGGQWAQGKTPTIVNAIGIAGIAIGLAALGQANAKLGDAFSWVILIGIAAVHLPAIANVAAGEPNRSLKKGGNR